MLVKYCPGGGLISAPDRFSRSRWYCMIARWNLASAARTSASVGAPRAGAAVTLAGWLGPGGLTGATSVWLGRPAGVVPTSPATGCTTCGCPCGIVSVEASVELLGVRLARDSVGSLVAGQHRERGGPARAAELEVEWWRVHRGHQREGHGGRGGAGRRIGIAVLRRLRRGGR